MFFSSSPLFCRFNKEKYTLLQKKKKVQNFVRKSQKKETMANDTKKPKKKNSLTV